MTSKKTAIKKIQTIILDGERVKEYINILTNLLFGARLNKFFPPKQKLINLLHFMIPENNRGFYNKLRINRDTGFPVEREITRVITDWQISPKTLKENTEIELEERYRQNPVEVNDRRLRRFRYHRELSQKEILNLFSLDMNLRSLDMEKYIAFFNVILDRFDASSSLFSRYTMVVGQEDPRWGRSQVILDGDDLKYTKNFRNLISKYTIDEAEFAYVLLNDLKHVVVEEVQRCRIGPLYFRGVRIPGGMEEIFKKHPDAFILSLPTDRASLHIKEDKNNDPLTVMYRDALDPDARELRDKKAEQIGYCVYKERKFVCSRKAVSDFRKFLKNRGARCVVYGA